MHAPGFPHLIARSPAPLKVWRAEPARYRRRRRALGAKSAARRPRAPPWRAPICSSARLARASPPQCFSSRRQSRRAFETLPGGIIRSDFAPDRSTIRCWIAARSGSGSSTDRSTIRDWIASRSGSEGSISRMEKFGRRPQPGCGARRSVFRDRENTTSWSSVQVFERAPQTRHQDWERVAGSRSAQGCAAHIDARPSAARAARGYGETPPQRGRGAAG